FRAKAITSVGRSWPLYSRLTRRMASRPRQVTDTRASRRSRSRTSRTTRWTMRSGSARGRPPTLTSLTRRHLPAGAEDAGRGGRAGGILDPVVKVAAEHTGKFLPHPLEVPQREGRVVELARGNALGDYVVDGGAHRVQGGGRKGPDHCLDRIGEHHHRRFARARPRAGIAELAQVDVRWRALEAGPVQEV